MRGQRLLLAEVKKLGTGGWWMRPEAMEELRQATRLWKRYQTQRRPGLLVLGMRAGFQSRPATQIPQGQRAADPAEVFRRK